MNVPAAQLLIVSPDTTVLRVAKQCALSLGHIPIAVRTVTEAKRTMVRASIDLLCLDSVLPAREAERFWRWLTTATDTPPRLVLFAPAAAKVTPAALPPFFQLDRDGLVSKPLDAAELTHELARALAAGARPRRKVELLRAGPLTLDLAAHQLYFGNGGAVALTPTEFRLVRYLVERPGQFIPVDELLEEVWGYAPDTGGAEVIRSHVNNIRRKIRAVGQDPQTIRNIPYRGYAIVAAQSAISA